MPCWSLLPLPEHNFLIFCLPGLSPPSQNISVQIDENALHEILNEVDLNKNGQVELNEFLQLMSAVKKGQVSDSRLAILMKTAEESLDLRGPVTVDRSGGGV
nr:glycerol-3-phosphate dehydrogenase, mitochondrial-like [Oncorhynchus nerka]XP_029510870.1 glycerol-3-phosphate dehydrogenase, mitochondrial-like [Oncorhynchus nerka]